MVYHFRCGYHFLVRISEIRFHDRRYVVVYQRFECRTFFYLFAQRFNTPYVIEVEAENHIGIFYRLVASALAHRIATPVCLRAAI